MSKSGDSCFHKNRNLCAKKQNPSDKATQNFSILIRREIMSFPQSVQDEALSACGRCCCICHKFCGTKIELHHIVQKANHGEDTFENCIPLCFDCHADMGRGDPKHPKGKRYSENELKMHRDSWYYQVATGGEQRRGVHISDKELFKKICSYFDADIRYDLRNTDFTGTVELHAFQSLGLLVHECKTDPFFKFIYTEMEKKKEELISSVQEFLSLHSSSVFPISAERGASRIWLLRNHRIPSNSDIKYDEYYEENVGEYLREADELNQLASTVLEKYFGFVMDGRRMLE